MRFPGSQPVSMDRRNICLLQNRYMVSWKADGARYLMYIRGPWQIYFIDRDSAVFEMQGLSFVSWRDRARHLVDTLLDGEMVIDREAGGKTTPRYLIYDIISLEGGPTLSQDFQSRYDAIMQHLIAPRIESMKEGRIKRHREPVGIRRKDFWPSSCTRQLLSDTFRQSLSHDSDGLVFQPVDAAYTPGTCPALMKWKPPALNSVDFRLKITLDELRKKRGDLYIAGQIEPFAQIELTKELKLLDNAIIECRWNWPQGSGLAGKWIFMRLRTDKSFPNSIKTVQAICLSIIEPVTQDGLTSFIDQHSPNMQPIAAN